MIPHLSKHTCTHACRPKTIPPNTWPADSKWIGRDGIGWKSPSGGITTYSETQRKEELARARQWRGIPLELRTAALRQERKCLAIEMLERWGYRRLRLAYGTHPQLECVYQQLLRAARRVA